MIACDVHNNLVHCIPVAGLKGVEELQPIDLDRPAEWFIPNCRLRLSARRTLDFTDIFLPFAVQRRARVKVGRA